MFKLFGDLFDSNEKQLAKLRSLVEKINGLSAEYETLADEQLRGKTAEFKTRLSDATAEVKKRIDDATRDIDAIKNPDTEESEFEKEAGEARIKSLEEEIDQLQNESRKKESEFLEKLLPEAFAAVREAARRTIKQRHFDVQLMGGMVLHQGKIAEMRTGEGKTLTATLPLYLNALTGRGCHLVTVNDYLARRDPNWMGPVYNTLGLSVACIFSQVPGNMMPSYIFDPAYEEENKPGWHLRPVTRKQAYEADITYGTNNEFGFDYLRDNMVADLSQRVQRSFDYAIVDEVDNLLIDEARTPLIISGQAEESGKIYEEVNSVVRNMKFKLQSSEPATSDEKEADAALDAQFEYVAYEKTRSTRETPRGQERLARAFGMSADTLFGGEGAQFTPEEAKKRHDIISIFRKAMAAHALYKKDVDYVLKDGEIIIVDEFTGRLMFGRRYSEGLHQAIEAKEGVKVQRESLTYATITFQNFFRMYSKLSGMTGTAVTEAEEFSKIYKLEVVVIPTNKPMVREDHTDVIYKNESGKFKAVARDVAELHKKGQPILVGTVSIEKSEYLSGLLKKNGVPHQILNARPNNLEKEAGIHAEAGKPGAVTVATNMAGRGVDIILGGKQPETDNEKEWREWQEGHNKVVALGGLHVIGTERHESRRIDNQLRGRAGRQGDAGSSRFYVSLEDDIVRRFGGDRIKGLMEWAGMDEDTPIENTMISRMIADVQKRVEGYNFDIRKHLVEYDDVVNTQRTVIYQERKKILSGVNLKTNILDMVDRQLIDVVGTHTNEKGYEWNYEGLLKDVIAIFPLPPDVNATAIKNLSRKELGDKLSELAHNLYEQREKDFGTKEMRLIEKLVMLRTIDSLWVEHLTTMEEMRLQAGWDQLQQIKAVDAYKNKGYAQFQVLKETIENDVVHTIFHVTIRKEPAKAGAPSAMAKAANRENVNKQPAPSSNKKPGRNDPCPCGSGKKYKHCCGR
jgi:preprotein translocase subunit SecA